MENECGEKVAMANVYVCLDDIGTNFNCHQKKFAVPSRLSIGQSHRQPYAVDEELAYKAVEELEQWKRQQQTDFVDELKVREDKYLAQLSREWERQRTDYEKQLTDKLNRCQMLTTALEEAQRALKVFFSTLSFNIVFEISLSDKLSYFFSNSTSFRQNFI